MMMAYRSPKGLPALALLVLLAMLGAPPVVAGTGDGDLSSDDEKALTSAVREWVKDQCRGTENEHGKKTKRGYFSRDFEPAGEDAGTYQVAAHLETAGEATKTTERYLLTLRRSDKAWEVSEHRLEDSFAGLHRETRGSCVPFDRMSFDREGLHLAGTNGMLCRVYYQDRVVSFAAHAPDASYHFKPPEHATAFHLMPDFHAVFDRIRGDHQRELEFDPAAFLFDCDPDTCTEVIEQHFSGIDESAATEFDSYELGAGRGLDWIRPLYDHSAKERRENPFVHFREPYRPGQRLLSVYIPRNVDPFTYPGFEDGLFDFSGSLPGPGVQLFYNNWGGYEVKFSVWPRRVDDPEQLFGTVYGYYTEETLSEVSSYDLERRDDTDARWHQVYSVKGDVDMGLDDPEVLAADIEFGIELKQPLRILPFYIQSIPQRDFRGKNKARVLRVNSVQLDGEELTWSRTSQLGGLVVLPETMPAGSKLNLRMNFETRAMVKYTHSFIEVSRFGWMPFVRFADFIDDFELTVRTPDRYTLLGIGHQVDERKEGNVRISRWRADSPVVFPSMTLGKYRSDTAGPKFKPATKIDGTPIPVVVHVDEASFMQWDIPPDSLRPLAQQAVNSINLYRDISGIDYPYGKLHFVNDPQGYLYGQAPSSLIYLGSGVFRGEGYLATLPVAWNATSISKFLKSVVAHEVGHQWWGSRVSNANGRNYWFVESLAEYFSALYLERVSGRKGYEEQVDEWRRTILDANLKSSVQNASAVWSGEGGFATYQAAVYNKGPFAFHMLREIFGDEKFFPFLKAFSQELAEKREIVTLDIQYAAERALGGIGPDGNPYTVDLSWFFDQWIRGSGLPQYRFVYDSRQTEDGGWLIEGTVDQRVLLGSKRDYDILSGSSYRGVVDVTVKTPKQEYKSRIVLDGEQTPFRLKVPDKPVVVELNSAHNTLAHDVLVNRPW